MWRGIHLLVIIGRAHNSEIPESPMLSQDQPRSARQILQPVFGGKLRFVVSPKEAE